MSSYRNPLTSHNNNFLLDLNLDLLCFSHLRWDFVFQRPQHLLSRFAKRQRVFFVEEPIFGGDTAKLKINVSKEGVHVVTPHLPSALGGRAVDEALQEMVGELLVRNNISEYASWYYTPMALKFTRHLQPAVMIYDCMDQLSHFKGAPPEMVILERELFGRVDVVFTGGTSLYESKKSLHPNVHAFPSSVDVMHFGSGRNGTVDPHDQAFIARPRIGFAGVIDERLDIELLDACARLRPDYQFVMIGPVVKIDPQSLPRRDNIHYLGAKHYSELPDYMANWDVAMLPFARNDATKYISPTKTPEYLAAGKPVVSTSIRDIVRPYGERNLVHIADEADDFVAAIDRCLQFEDRTDWLAKVDNFLATNSWDRTFERMWSHITTAYYASQLKSNYTVGERHLIQVGAVQG